MIGISVMLATSGFPVIISKLLNDYGSANRAKILRVSMLFYRLSASAFLLLFAGAGAIAGFMGDLDLAGVIRAVSFSYLLLPFVSLLRGYFQGSERMLPTALSQIGEQTLRVGAILVLTWWLVKSGFSLYDAGAGAAFGSLVGGLAAFFILAVFWAKREKKATAARMEAGTGDILKQLCLYSVTICTAGLMLILIQLVDALHLYSLLAGQGMGELQAKHTKGVYDRGSRFCSWEPFCCEHCDGSCPVPYESEEKGRNCSAGGKDPVFAKNELCHRHWSSRRSDLYFGAGQCHAV